MTAPTPRWYLVLFALFGTAGALEAAPAQFIPLTSVKNIHPVGVSVTAVKYLGRRAVRVQGEPTEGYQMAILEGTTFKNGEIEADLAGRPARGASETARGFVGIAFRVALDASRFDCFYLRPTNGRADDQVRRNHSTQYIAHPGFPFDKLRAEAPGRYESYVDLVPGEWTRVRIAVDGRKARFFVNGASQPCLIVNDLKVGEDAGAIALWIGDETEAWFRNVRITPK
jgi:hypothetical protein